MPRQNLTIIFVIKSVLILLFVIPLHGDEVPTVQGTGIVHGVISELEMVVNYVDAQNVEDGPSLLMKAKELWDTFTDHHNAVFTKELNPSAALLNLIDKASEDFDIVIQSCTDGIDQKAVDGIQHISETLTELTAHLNQPVLLDFTGAACKACRTMKTRLQSIAEDYEGKVRIVIVNVNDQRKYTKKFKVMLIPTIVFIDRDGAEIARHVGEMEEHVIKNKLAELME